MSFIQSPLFISDLEFTGLDPTIHEIIEIGVVKVDQEKMEVVGELEMRIAPQHIETADPEGIKRAGYDETLWQGALPLDEALNKLTTFVGTGTSQPAKFAGWTQILDWTYLSMVYRKYGKPCPFDYITFDICTLAQEYLKNESNIPKFSLSNTSIYLGIEPEPIPHRAVNGARQAFLVLKKLRELGV
ncbi:MAG: 3'-5' exonuclease [Patescibacteria group bacterium]